MYIRYMSSIFYVYMYVPCRNSRDGVGYTCIRVTLFKHCINKYIKINVLDIIIKKFRSFKSKENIRKKVVGPYHGFGY